ncbi:biotin--[acetyl-CoA-carboxylase] ligase [bacterium]|nr:biotin--[acetyl-CoA-carboxylase] ligase [bacterium]
MDTHYVAFRIASAPSTQAEARARFIDSPVLVVADRQTEGRGRIGSVWVTAPRAVAASLAMPVAWPAPARSLIPLVAALAAVEHLPGDVTLKWPNDLLVGESKVGGILVESDGDCVVIGIGINFWWPDPMPGAAGLFAEDPGSDEADRFAGPWAASLVRRLGADPQDWGRDEYLARCVTVGSAVEWEPHGSGVAVGVSADGALLVEVEGSVIALDSGVVRTIRPL